MIDELPPLDVLFNCAGYVHHGTILDCTPKDWDFSFNLNVRAMYIAIQRGAAEDARQARRPGKRPASSTWRRSPARSKGIPNRFVYGASKAAVVGLTKAVAADYVHKGIRCNAIAPGHGRHAVAAASASTPSPIRSRRARMFIARQPMGRLAKPEEIAPIVVFLASDESAFATGNVYSVDGGMTI